MKNKKLVKSGEIRVEGFSSKDFAFPYQDFWSDFLGNFSSKMVFLLSGDLGAGKTTLVRDLVYSLGVGCWGPEEGEKRASQVQSPSFSYHNVYSDFGYSLAASGEIREASRRLTLHHFDLYRLSEDAGDEAIEFATEKLGFWEVFEEAHSWVAIEWPQRLALKVDDFCYFGCGVMEVQIYKESGDSLGESRGEFRRLEFKLWEFL